MSARFVLLAGCLGRTFAKDNASRGAEFLSSGPGTVCKPLLVCAGQCVLNYWLKQIEECPRLQDRTWIVVNKEHLSLYQAWARQNSFPAERLICNGAEADHDNPGDVRDLALALPGDHDEWVFCARADYVFEPQQSLRHFVESAFITDRVTVAMSPATPVSLEAGLRLVTSPATEALRGESFMSSVLIKAGNTVKVDSCSMLSAANSEWVSVPLLGLPPQACKELADSLQSLSGQESTDGWRSLERLVSAQSAKRPLTGFKCTPIFSVRSLKQFLFTNHFFHHLQRRRAEAHAELTQTIPAPRCSVGPEVLLGTSKADVDLKEMAKRALEVDLHLELKRFSFDEETALLTLSQVAGCDLTLPTRFVKAKEWSYATRRKQHPCYTTSNSSYGLKNPKPADMPLAWNGIKGEFTKHSEGATRDKGLRCFTAMSNVHKSFDEYTHYR